MQNSFFPQALFYFYLFFSLRGQKCNLFKHCFTFLDVENYDVKLSQLKNKCTPQKEVKYLGILRSAEQTLKTST